MTRGACALSELGRSGRNMAWKICSIQIGFIFQNEWSFKVSYGHTPRNSALGARSVAGPDFAPSLSDNSHGGISRESMDTSETPAA